jgi:hypothetical protein
MLSTWLRKARLIAVDGLAALSGAAEEFVWQLASAAAHSTTKEFSDARIIAGYVMRAV